MEALDVFKLKATEIASLAPEEYNTFVDNFEASLVKVGTPVDCPLLHEFADGIYRRWIFMPAGSLISSKIHLTNHFWVMTRGAAYVIQPGSAKLIQAPYHGITEPNTRRMLMVVADCEWATYHLVGDETDIDKIEEKIILKRTNPLLESCPTSIP